MTKSLLLLITLLPSIVFATDLVVTDRLDLTSHWVGYTALALFAIAYILFTTASLFWRLMCSQLSLRYIFSYYVGDYLLLSANS